MKTLKQLFKEFSDRPEEPEIGVIYTSITNKEFQEIVKEWLTQKRQEYDIRGDLAQKYTIDRLLEELQEE